MSYAGQDFDLQMPQVDVEVDGSRYSMGHHSVGPVGLQRLKEFTADMVVKPRWHTVDLLYDKTTDTVFSRLARFFDLLNFSPKSYVHHSAHAQALISILGASDGTEALAAGN